MRGSGKTTVAQLLSQQLKVNWLDIDQEIEAETNNQISDIVAKHGWEHFRKLEKNKISQVCQKPEPLIISTGGGSIVDSDNFEQLIKAGTIFFLHVEVSELAQRLSNQMQNRPSLTNQSNLEAELISIWQERENLYTSRCDHQIEATNKTPKEICAEITELLER